MADRSVSVRLRLRISEFEAGANGVKKNLTGLNKKFAETAGFAAGFRKKLEDATKKLPKIEIDANSTPAEVKLAELRAKLEKLSGKEIGVDIDASQALVEMAALQHELEGIGDGASFEVRADIGSALADLNAITREVQRLDGQKVAIDIEADKTFADRLRAQVEQAARSLPKIQIDADSTPAQVKIAELRDRLVSLADKKVGVDVDSGAAMTEIAAIERELNALTGSKDIEVRVNAGSALAELSAISGEVNRVDGRSARVNVNADVGGALTSIALVGAALAALPAVTTIAVGVSALGAAFTAAGVGAAGFAAVAGPSLGRINDALKQQETAASGAGGATKSAGQSAAQAASQALQLEQAERRVTDAQKAVKTAQEDLTRARQAAKRANEDLTLSVKDAALAEEDAALSVEEARQRLAEVQADPKATELERKRAELNYREAVQRLEDQGVRTKRLQQDKATADKAGVEGSDQVKSAQERLLKSQRDLVEAQKQLTVTQLQQKAALEQTGGAAGGAISKFAQLSRAEQALAKDVKAFQDGYLEWQRSLQPSVFPAIRSGMDLMSTGMKIATPLVKGSAGAFNGLLKELNSELKGAAWQSFFNDLSTVAPRAIEGLGHAAINVAGGLSGVIQAFLPFTDDLMTFLESATAGFEKWGRNLKGSPEFEKFIAYVREQGPKVGEILSNIATFVGKVFEVGAGAAPGLLDFLVGLSEKLAGLDPAQVEAVAKGVGLIFAAMKLGASLQVAGLVLLAEVLNKMSPGQIQAVAVAIAAVVGAVKGYQIFSSVASMLGGFGGGLDKAGKAADGAKGKFGGLLSSLATGGGIAAILGTAAVGVDKVSDSLSGLNPDIAELSKQMVELQRAGKPAAEQLGAFGSNLDTLAGDMGRTGVWFAPTVGQFESLGDTVKRLNDDGVLASFGTSFASTVDSVTGGLYSMDTGVQRLGNADKTLAEMVKSGNGAQAAALFNELAKQSGLAGQDVGKLRDQLPGYSAAVAAAGGASAAAAGGVDQAKTKLDGFNSSLDAFAGRTDALTAMQNLKTAYNEAERAIEAANGKLQVNAMMTNAQRDAVITAREKFADYIGAVKTAADGAFTLTGRTTESTRAVLEQLPHLGSLAGKNAEAKEQVLLLAQAYGISRDDAIKAMTSAEGLKKVLAELKSKEIRIGLTLDTAAAEKEFGSFLARYSNKSLAIAIAAKVKATGGIQTSTGVDLMARGGIQAKAGAVALMAAGGMRTPPPNIANQATYVGGSSTVYAEAGKEAYVPYDPQYRDRAVQVLGTVAQDFGLTLGPGGGSTSNYSASSVANHSTTSAPSLTNSSRVSAPQQAPSSWSPSSSAGSAGSPAAVPGGSTVNNSVTFPDMVVRESADASVLFAQASMFLGSRG